MSENYTPFGAEWAAEVKKLTKDQLVGMLRKACVERDGAMEALEDSQRASKEAKRELARWREPFDPETFAGIKKQASHSDSLAAYSIYVTALEHALKHSQATCNRSRDALAEALTSLEFVTDTLGRYVPLVKRAAEEIMRNAHKGPWEDWLPDNAELAREIAHHASKLCHAANDSDRMEFAADLANYCEKVFSMCKHQAPEPGVLSSTASGLAMREHRLAQGLERCIVLCNGEQAHEDAVGALELIEDAAASALTAVKGERI